MDFLKKIKPRPPLLGASGALVVAASFAATPAQAMFTKVNSGVFNGTYYQVWKKDSGTLTWTEAKTYAETTLLSKLVSLNTNAENTFVSSLIQDPQVYTAATNAPANNYVGPYIGAFRTGSGPATVGWQWVDGTPLTTSSPTWVNWANFASQPDMTNGDNVALYYNGNNGSPTPPVGQPGYPTTWGDVFDGSTISTGPGSPGPNPYLANSFIIEFAPGPLPVMGALVGFRFSRRLRRRTNAAVRNV